MPSDWRPIETAPKDGTWVLIAGGWLGDEDPYEYEYTGVGIAAFHRGAWVRDGAEYRHAPTHWMPLPDTPETDDAEC